MLKEDKTKVNAISKPMMRRIRDFKGSVSLPKDGLIDNGKLDELLMIERSLERNKLERKQIKINIDHERFQRKCNCSQKDLKLASQQAKHYLYHKYDPNVKWPVESIKDYKEKE